MSPQELRQKEFAHVLALDADEFELFRLFYHETLGEGSGTFLYTHPITSQPATMMFAEKYKVARNGRIWLVACRWKVLPQ